MGGSFAIFLTGYVSLWQPELAEKAKAAEPAPKPKYQRNRLDDDEAKELVRKLEALMEDEKLYRDAALTSATLADRLAVSPHTLSQVLNVHVGKSFFVFVNTYRAKALEELLVDPKQAGRGVLELGLEVGFNSKTTLNSFFKKHTGVTPTDFRKSKTREKSPG
jgi:AraC-like DNA-binding protein